MSKNNTKEYVNKMKSIMDNILKKEDNIKKEKEEKDILWKERKELMSKCTHTYPDGTSAWENGYAYGSCNICNMHD